MKIEPITTAEQALRAIADGRRVEFRAVIGESRGRWADVGSPRMSVEQAFEMFDELLRLGEVRACRK